MVPLIGIQLRDIKNLNQVSCKPRAHRCAWHTESTWEMKMKLQVDPHCRGCPLDTEPNGVPTSERSYFGGIGL